MFILESRIGKHWGANFLRDMAMGRREYCGVGTNNSMWSTKKLPLDKGVYADDLSVFI